MSYFLQKAVMKDRVKATHYTRVEGGTIQEVDFEFYEDQLNDIKVNDVHKKEVFSKIFNKKLTTRVVKMGKVWVHALFFENGKVYDVIQGGWKLRELHGEAIS